MNTQEKQIRDSIRPELFEVSIDMLGLPVYITRLLTAEGYSTVGDLVFQMKLDPESILAISGVGPRTKERVEKALKGFKLPIVRADAGIRELAGEGIGAEEIDTDRPDLLKIKDKRAKKPAKKKTAAKKKSKKATKGKVKKKTKDDKKSKKPKKKAPAKKKKKGTKKGKTKKKK